MLTKTQIQHLLQKMTDAAIEAGKLIQSRASQEFTVMDKYNELSQLENQQLDAALGSQVVTEVDFLAQEAILKILTPEAQAHNFAILTEESEDDKERLVKDYFFAIDPLDGTLSFAKGVSGYSVSIALVSRDEKPIIGVVYDPVSEHLYTAAAGLGVQKNGSPLEVPVENLQQASLTLLVDSSFMNSSHLETVQDVVPSLFPEQQVLLKHIGGAVISALTALEQPGIIYFKFPKPQKSGGSIWDYAATACIYEQAGAYATDIYGEAFELNTPNSTFMNHKGLIYAKTQQAQQSMMQLCLLAYRENENSKK